MTPRHDIRTPRSAALNLAMLLAVVMLAIMCPAPSAAHAAVTQPAFPHIAIWWPDADRQPAADLARCDWIALHADEAGHIAQLRALNPGILVLGTTSARELNYSLDGYNDPTNVELRSASTDWILTQVGSTLTDDINASTTSIPVADASKFRADDMVLVDHELMHVDSVHDHTLTVSVRGPVDPPAAHSSGARIAATVSHWPGTITFDITTDCPKVDVGYGPETWAEWNVRRGATTLRSAPWDGLLIDALEGELSWMITVGDVRSIDPSRSNVLVTDGYKAFNAEWYAGAIAYGTALRAACGNAALVSNGNNWNPAVNGNIFEQFPYDGLPAPAWETVIVGSQYGPPQASYHDWCAHAASPNLTLIQVYGASTDYALMRYGLCTALMDDGYFSYALSSSVHARGGLDWFDEYDNAGVGRGYLGQPTGPAMVAGAAWRRDYTNGVVLVNPSDQPATVGLGGTFRKIKGKQDPKVNDGTTVTSVEVPAQDGLILLRVPDPTDPGDPVPGLPALRASNSSVTFGQKTTLQVEATTVPTEDVRIEQRAAGSSGWTGIATVTPDASGGALIVRAPTLTTEYRVVSVGTRVVSNTVKVGVRPRVTVSASRSKVRRTQGVTFSGSVTYHGRVRVALQLRSHGKWRTVRSVLTSAAGNYKTKLHFASRGHFTYRVHLAAAVRHLAATSRAITVVVR